MMSQAQVRHGTKRSTNLTLPEALVEEARSLDINLSEAAAEGIAAAIRRARDERWKERNREAMESWNGLVAREGLPLEDLRLF
jgi:antitoxin CcdA